MPDHGQLIFMFQVWMVEPSIKHFPRAKTLKLYGGLCIKPLIYILNIDKNPFGVSNGHSNRCSITYYCEPKTVPNKAQGQARIPIQDSTGFRDTQADTFLPELS
jgi:hypothetical protein